MPEKTACDVCGELIDPRGMTNHKRFKHGQVPALADGGQMEVKKDELDASDEEIEEALPATNVEEDSIVFRSVQEIEVNDEEMKRELLETLKESVRGEDFRL
jgi:hypothetical protein